jgi:hypothetical protein
MEDDMKLKCNHEGTKGLRVGKHRAVFVNGVATVSKESGDALAAAYPDHVEVVKETTTRKSKEK